MNTATEQAMLDRQPTMDEVAEAHRYFVESIRGVINARAHVYNFRIPTITISEGGEISSEYRLTEQDKQSIEMADEFIEHMSDLVKKKLVNGDFR